MVVDGQLVEAKSGSTFPIISPTTEEQLCSVPDADETDVDIAVAAARRAFADWKALDVRERGRLMRALAKRLSEHGEELASA